MTTRRPSFDLLVLLGLVATFPVAADDPDTFYIDPDTFSASLGEGETALDAFDVHIPADAAVPTVDVYILADTTGSMGSALSSVKSGATALVTSLYGLSDVDLAIGVGNYKDFPYDSYAFQHQVDPEVSAGQSTVLAGITAWSAGGGYDGSEGQFFALYNLAWGIDPDSSDGIGWREGSKKIIVWFGDAPGHDPVCSAISGLADDITEASVTADLAENDVVVLAIGTMTGYSGALDDNPASSAYNYTSYCGTPGGTSGQATRIAAATGGSYSEGVSSTDLAATISMLVEEEAGDIGNLSVEPVGDIVDYVTSISPASGYDDIDTTLAGDYAFEVEFTGECQTTQVTLTGSINAVADGAVVAQQAVSITLESCNEAPVAVCEDQTVVADGTCAACASVDGGSYDPDGDDFTIVEDPGCDYDLGDNSVTLTITDEEGATDSCTAIVTVLDESEPTVDCGSTETMIPPDAPISFTATSEDNCDESDATVEVTAYDCWTVNGAGKVIDKTSSCEVSFDGDTVTIDDSGGVGDIIEWTVSATDASGNTTEQTCTITVVNPGKAKK